MCSSTESKERLESQLYINKKKLESTAIGNNESQKYLIKAMA